MFHQYCCQFLEYYQLADFSPRSIYALTSRFNELTIFFKNTKNPFFQKGLLPSSDRFYGRLQQSLL